MSNDLLAELHRRGIRLRLRDGRLDVVAPAGALTDELREALRSRRDELTDLLGREGVGAPLSVTADPEHRHDPFPLTDIQHAYWVGRHTGVELGGVSCHWYMELDGEDLDPDRLEASLRRVIQRHDMLRAVVDPDGRQRVLAEVPPYRLARTDLRGLDEAARQAALAATYAEMSHQVLAADTWPLFDIRVSRTSERGTRLHVSLDVLILDGLSLNLLFRDWRRFYEDPAADLDVPGVAYRDFVVAEEAARAGAGYAAAERYWLGRLDELPPAPRLPLKVSPEQIVRPVFGRRRGALPPPRWESVRTRAAQRGLTPSVVLLTAYAEVLGRWSDQSAMTLNLTLFNRPEQPADLSEVIGDFTSVSLLAVHREPGEPFAVRAGRLQRQFLRDLEHSAYSGVRVLRERARRLGDGLGAAMPVVFTSALVTADRGTPLDSDFFGRYVDGVSQTPQVWLDHQVTEQNGHLLFHWDAVEELFPAGVLDDMFAAYRDLLERLAQPAADWDHDEFVAALPAAQAALRRQVNATEAPIRARTLGDLVEERAAAQPEAPAVIAVDRTLTYAEVSGEANRLANHLVARGAARGHLVAVVLDKGWEQVVAVLGVVRSGAAYLPIDPAWPAARREHLLAHGRVALVVTTPALREAVHWPDEVSVVTLDDPAVRDTDPGRPAAIPTPDDLAYTIFTSGSTGEPKGVMIDHRGAANTVQDINDRFGVIPIDRVLALSSLTFDLSVYDIFGTLAAGAAIVMPSPEGAHDPAHWDDLVRRHGVTIWNSVPALARTWMENTSPPATGDRSASTLRLMLLSGDWIPVDLPDTVRAAWPDVEVISLGGATEASIWSIYHPIGTVPPDWVRIPYGTPLANQQMYVYDAGLRDCPVWTVGEIYIGGVGVALGYWADPERTAERFLTHPRTGARLYRTGDLGRYLPDGTIEFLGRADFQVKINGYRIELGEIEAALRRLPGVGDAVAHVDTHPASGRRQLVAYVVPETAEGAADPGRAIAAGMAALTDAAWVQHADLARFANWWERVEAICPAIMARTLALVGAFTTAGDVGTAEGIVAHAGLQPRHTGLIGYWLRVLAERGVLADDGDGVYRSPHGLSADDLDRTVTSTLDGITVDGVHRVFLDYFRACAAHQVELLDGRISPLELLLPDGGNRVTDALYAANPAARVNNQIVAAVARAAAADRAVRILEVGAGTGSTTAVVLPHLPDRVSYRFTDVSTYFTDQARSRFADYPFVEYGRFDVDGDPAAQGVPPGSVDVLIAANVLHDARDLPTTLRRLRTTLAAGGLLVLIEGTTNSLIQALTVGYIEGFAQPHAGRDLPLLDVEQWRAELAAAGFAPVAVLPDGPPVTPAMPQHVIVAVAPAGAADLQPAALRAGLEAELPEYLVPAQYVVIDRVPLSANGKVDRTALPTPWHAVEALAPVAPAEGIEATVHGIWADALGHGDFGVEDNFFELGGDSLHAIRILTRVRDEFGLDLTADDGLQMLFDSPTISQLAKALEKRIDR